MGSLNGGIDGSIHIDLHGDYGSVLFIKFQAAL